MDETVGKEVIVAVLSLLAKFPQVEHEVDGGVLKIKGSADGFDIEIEDDTVEATIWAGPWHGHASDPEDAALFIAWLLSPKARITTNYRGKHQVRSMVELHHLDGQWREHEVVCTVAPPFGKRSVRQIANSVIAADEVPMK